MAAGTSRHTVPGRGCVPGGDSGGQEPADNTCAETVRAWPPGSSGLSRIPCRWPRQGLSSLSDGESWSATFSAKVSVALTSTRIPCRSQPGPDRTPEHQDHKRLRGPCHQDRHPVSLYLARDGAVGTSVGMTLRRRLQNPRIGDRRGPQVCCLGCGDPSLHT